jgi:hypothetical protein
MLLLNSDKVPQGHTRMETKFIYPDGSSVDMFQPLGRPGVLTDFGNTMTHCGVDPFRDPHIRRMLHFLGVSILGGQLETTFEPEELHEAILRLGRACFLLSFSFKPEKHSKQSPIIIFHSVNREGQTFALDPSSKSQIREVCGEEIYLPPRVFIAFDLKQKEKALPEDIFPLIGFLLTGLSNEEIERLGGISFFPS